MPRMPRIGAAADEPNRHGSYSAPGVTPMGNASGDQMQDLGRNIQRLGATIDVIAEKEQDRYDDAKKLQAANLYASSIEEDLDGPEGYTSKLGQDAAAGREAVLAKLAERRKAAEALLDNPVQREAFAAHADHLSRQAQSRVNAHYGQQVQVFEQGQLSAAFEQEAQNFRRAIAGAKGGTVAGDAGMAASRAMGRAEQLADSKGWREGPQREQLLRKARATLHEGAVREMISTQQPEKARQYLAGVPKDDLDGTTSDRLQDLVKRGTVADESLTLAQRLRTGGRPLLDQQKDLDDLRAKGLGAEVYDATWNRLRAYDAEDQQQRAVASVGVLQEAQVWGLKQENLRKPFAAMPPDQQQQIVRTGNVDRVAQFLEEGRWRTTPAGLDAYLKTSDAELRKIPSREALVDRYRQDLDNGKLEKLVERWHGLQEGKQGPGLAKFERDLVVAVYARRMNVLPPSDISKPSAAQVAEYEEFELRVDNAVRATTGGKPASPADYEKVLKGMVADKFQVGGALWGATEKVVAASTPAELNAGYTVTSSGREVYNQNISDAEKEQILQAIDVYNAAAAEFNKTAPLEQRAKLKPTTLAQIAEEWDQQQIEARAARTIEHERRRKQLLEAAQPGPRPGDQFLPPALQPGKTFTPPPMRPPR